MNGYNSTLQEEHSQNRALFTFDPNLEAPTAIGKSQISQDLNLWTNLIAWFHRLAH